MTLDCLPEYVISDTHFGHHNIVRYCHRPQDHDQLMLDRWRATVPPQATVLHLGDVIFRNPALVPAMLATLPGRIHFIPGNHDKRPMRSALQRIGWHVVTSPLILPFGAWQ